MTQKKYCDKCGKVEMWGNQKTIILFNKNKQTSLCEPCYKSDEKNYWLNNDKIIIYTDSTEKRIKWCHHTGDKCYSNCSDCKKVVGEKDQSKSASEQSSTSPTDTQKQQTNNSWWVRQSTGTKAVIIGSGVVLGIILIGVVYYISKKKKNVE